MAYIQQIFVKTSVSPWHKDLLAVDVFRSPLSRAFQLVEEIRNHVLRDRYPLRDPSLPEPCSVLRGDTTLSVTPLSQPALQKSNKPEGRWVSRLGISQHPAGPLWLHSPWTYADGTERALSFILRCQTEKVSPGLPCDQLTESQLTVSDGSLWSGCDM